MELTAVHVPESQPAKAELTLALDSEEIDAPDLVFFERDNSLQMVIVNTLQVPGRLRRSGIGRLIYKSIVAAAEAAGVNEIRFEVDDDGRTVWPKVEPRLEWDPASPHQAWDVIRGGSRTVLRCNPSRTAELVEFVERLNRRAGQTFAQLGLDGIEATPDVLHGNEAQNLIERLAVSAADPPWLVRQTVGGTLIGEEVLQAGDKWNARVVLRQTRLQRSHLG